MTSPQALLNPAFFTFFWHFTSGIINLRRKTGRAVLKMFSKALNNLHLIHSHTQQWLWAAVSGASLDHQELFRHVDMQAGGGGAGGAGDQTNSPVISGWPAPPPEPQPPEINKNKLENKLHLFSTNKWEKRPTLPSWWWRLHRLLTQLWDPVCPQTSLIFSSATWDVHVLSSEH